jgi:hypothetical protein
MRTVNIDLHSDWANILKSQLNERGYQIPIGSTNDDICLMYFNLRNRTIEPKRRKVLIAREFICPPTVQDRFDSLKSKIENGDSLNSHTSKHMADPAYNDLLFNDWKIYHLHMNTRIDPDGFTNRDRNDPLNDYLLYARFDDNSAYLINIYKHGAWTKQEMVKIIHNNWPDTIRASLLENVVELNYKASDDDLKSLRKNHLNTCVEVNPGIIYRPIGLGSSSDGTNSEIVMVYNRYMHKITKIEKAIKKQIGQIEKAITSDGKVVPRVFDFHLLINNNEFNVIEQNTNIVFKINA